MIYVTRPLMPDIEDYKKELESIWESRWISNMGNKHQEFEDKIRNYLGINNISLYSCGHSALEAAIASFDFPKGSEIITTAYTFVSTTHAIVRNGLVPVFCDIDINTCTIDASQIESLITDKTVAILPVHTYGNACDVEAIDKIAKEYGLKVIYDAAHAFGVKYEDNSILNYGDLSILSFHATKVYNTAEGGAVCYKDEKYREIMEDLKNFGIRDYTSIAAIGGNSKMSEINAALGICNLRLIDQEIENRKAIWEHYMSRFKNLDGIVFPRTREGFTMNYSYFPVIIEAVSRDELQDILRDNGIEARKYFYPLTCDAECYEYMGINSKELLPNSSYVSDRILTLPIYGDLDIKDVDRIADIVVSFVGGNK